MGRENLQSYSILGRRFTSIGRKISNNSVVRKSTALLHVFFQGKQVMARIFKTVRLCFSVILCLEMRNGFYCGISAFCTVYTILFTLFSSAFSLFFFPAYSTFYIVGLILSMQIPFVGFQPIRTSEHMAAAGKKTVCFQTACSAQENLKPL